LSPSAPILSAPVQTAPRTKKRKKTGPGQTVSKALEILRKGRASAQELEALMVADGYPFAPSSNRMLVVRGALTKLTARGSISGELLPGRGKVYSITHHGAPTIHARRIVTGISNKSIKILATEGISGPGLPATEITKRLIEEGHNFAGDALGSTTAILSYLHRKERITRQKRQNIFFYRILPTSELIRDTH